METSNLKIGQTLKFRGKNRILKDINGKYVKLENIGCWFTYCIEEGF
jgi:hypothetical protein